jgi:predicted esterase
MKLKNWQRKSVLACAISLLAAGAEGQEPAKKIPAIALVDAGDAAEWQAFVKDLGWQVIAPAAAANLSIDQRVLALAKAAQDAVKNSGVDPNRIYLAGRGDAASAVFYTISRVPDLWAGSVAVGGSPKAAIDTDRIFTANFTNTPVLWVSGGVEDEAQAQKLKTAGLNIEWRKADSTTIGAVLEWLAKRTRDEFPREIDCETNSPTFAGCYWIRLTKFDAGERNDVLPSTRLPANPTATLDLGGFGYKKDDSGPGILVSFLPEKYNGPLRMGDRIISLDGREVKDARQYVDLMAKFTETKSTAVMVQRGKDKQRIETQVVLPRRDLVVTARVEAQYLPADKEIQIVSRTVTEMRVTVPPQWAGSKLFWNGLSLSNSVEAGCWALAVEKELLHAARCP